MGTVGDEIELADAVESVRDGLLAAAARQTGSDLRFEVGEIEMEFTVEVRRDARARGGVRAWVVDTGAEAGTSKGRTHRVSFTLRPKNARTGADWQIGSEAEADVSGFTRRLVGPATAPGSAGRSGDAAVVRPEPAAGTQPAAGTEPAAGTAPAAGTEPAGPGGPAPDLA